jgi:hypothetical protein
MIVVMVPVMKKEVIAVIEVGPGRHDDDRGRRGLCGEKADKAEQNDEENA